MPLLFQWEVAKMGGGRGAVTWGAIVFATCIVAACVGDEPGASSDAGTDGGANGDGNSVGDARPTTPTHAPQSVTFVDQDPSKGTVAGLVAITKAADESDVTSYALYWGSDGNTRLGNAIATFPKTGADVSYSLTGAVPVGANDLLAFSVNAVGEMATGASYSPVDNYPRFVDISAGQTSGGFTSTTIDTINHKLLVVSEPRPGLFRCDLDGTGCVFTDLSRQIDGGALAYADGGALPSAGAYPTALVDATNHKLLVVTAVSPVFNTYNPGLFRCALDGTDCTFVDISAGQTGSGAMPTAIIDSIHDKLLVVADNANLQPGLFRCNLDGTSCTYTDISAGQGTSSSAERPSVAIDAVNAKLVVATNYAPSNEHEPGLFLCDLDGSNCVFHNTNVAVAKDGYSPNVLIDAAHGAILIVTVDMSAGGSVPSLFRCNLDGTGCLHVDISAGHDPATSSVDFAHSAVLDAVNGKLLTAAQDYPSGNLGLFRCGLDGTACAYLDMSAGQANGAGANPSAVIDTTNGRLLVAASNQTLSYRPGLFTLGLW